MSLGWITKPLKFACSINRSALNEKTPHGWVMIYLDISSVDSAGNIGDLETLTFDSAPSRARRVVTNGDTVISTVRTYLKAIAFIKNPPENLIASTGFAVLSPRDDIDPRFLWWFVQNHGFVSSVVANSEGVGYPAIAPSRLANLKIEFPRYGKQIEISSYLDEQTAKIDRLIDMRRQQIELLKEQRAALIQQVVTRGLNPDATMKDSGVVWLGEIPAHWTLSKLKSLCSTTKGFAFKSELFVDEGIPVVRASEIKDFTVVACCTFIQPDIAMNYRQVTLGLGDILISTVGSKADVRDSAVGQVGIVPSELDGALLNQNTVKLCLDCQQKVSKNFLINILKTDSFRKHLDLHAHGTANQASLSLVDILSFAAPTPPFTEQIAIAEFIDNRSKQIDRVSEVYSRQLTLLAEYRAALIHECVTGQRQVPDIPASLQEEAHAL